MHIGGALFIRRRVAPNQKRLDDLFLIDQDRHEAAIEQVEVDLAVKHRWLASPFFDHLAGVNGLHAARVHFPKQPLAASRADRLLIRIDNDGVRLSQNEQ